MPVLNAKQYEDLNFAVLEYLMKSNFERAATAFKEEAQVDYDGYLQSTNTPSSLLKDILERKWTSIAKLMKQNKELEKQCKQLQETNEQHQIDIKNMETEFRENGGVLKSKVDLTTGGEKQDMLTAMKATGDAIPREPENKKLKGHRARITKCSFHPVYTQIATSSEDATIKLWDYETGECEQTLREHTGMVNYLNFNHNGESLASCARDMTIKLWKINKEQEFKCFKTLKGHEHEVSCVEFLKPNGDHLISCSRDQSIRIWDTNSGFLLQTLNQHNEWVRRITQNAQGALMASASKDETVIIWNMDKIKQNLNNSQGVDQQDYIITMIDEHDHVIDCIQFAPEAACQTIQAADYSKFALNDANQTGGESMIDSTGDNTRGADDSEMMEEQKRLDGETSHINDSVRITTQQKVAKLKADLLRKKALLRGEIVDEDGETKQQDPNESIQIDTSKQEQQEIEAGQLKDYIATGSRDKKIRIFEVKSGHCVLTLAGHDNWVTDIMFHPNGKYLMSTADDKSIRIWDLSQGRCYRKIYNAHDHFISCFDMKGKLAATGSVDTSLKIWSCR